MTFLSDLWQKLKTWERGFHLAVGAGLPPSDCHLFDHLFCVQEPLCAHLNHVKQIILITSGLASSSGSHFF